MSGAVLIVGGAGYIGSHCAKIMSRRGYDVVSYDNLSRGFRDAVKYGGFVEGDIGDDNRLDALFGGGRFDAVMHFAAFANVGESVEKPALYLENNFRKTGVLLEAMARHDVRHFIFSSTCATYGLPRYVPMDEKHPQAPINPYGESKLKVETLLREFNEKRGLKYVCFRYFNAAGCDPEGELGERHDPETHLIPLAVRAALGTGPALKVFGTDYDTQDHTCVRDYIHVNDLSDAHVLGLEYLKSGGESGAFNLGNGNGFSVMEIIKTVKHVSGLDLPYGTAPRRPGDPPVLVGNAEKARRILGWKIQFTDIEDIIRTAYKWEKRK